MTSKPQRKRATRKSAGYGDMEPDIIRGAENNDFDEVQAALQKDWRDVNKQDIAFGLTALHIAAGKGNLNMVAFLLEQREVDARLKDRWGRDALDVAMIGGHRGVIDALFRFRADQLEARGRRGKTAKKARTSRVLPFKPK